jgi:hypothetical protein
MSFSNPHRSIPKTFKYSFTISGGKNEKTFYFLIKYSAKRNIKTITNSLITNDHINIYQEYNIIKRVGNFIF